VWIPLLTAVVMMSGILAVVGYYLGAWYVLLTLLLLVLLDEPTALWLLRSHSEQALTGKEAMIGKLATVITEFQETGGWGELRGKVHFNGEIWSAEAKLEEHPQLYLGRKVRIGSMNGLVLKVEAISHGSTLSQR
jgi:membrane protein implicated in regulation of membrane protease activity